MAYFTLVEFGMSRREVSQFIQLICVLNYRWFRSGILRGFHYSLEIEKKTTAAEERSRARHTIVSPLEC